MPSSDDDGAQYLVRFREITEGLEPDQLHSLLGELLQEPEDLLEYVYDYGDD